MYALPLQTIYFFFFFVPASTAVAQTGYGKHWKYEKLVTVSLLGLIPAGLLYPNAVVDYGLALTIPLHGHWYGHVCACVHVHVVFLHLCVCVCALSAKNVYYCMSVVIPLCLFFCV